MFSSETSSLLLPELPPASRRDDLRARRSLRRWVEREPLVAARFLEIGEVLRVLGLVAGHAVHRRAVGRDPRVTPAVGGPVLGGLEPRRLREATVERGHLREEP